MRKLLLSFITLVLIISCQKDFSEIAPEIKIIEIHTCPPSGDSIAMINAYRYESDKYSVKFNILTGEVRNTRFTFKVPDILNDYDGNQICTPYICNCAFKFFEEDTFNADTLQLQNIGRYTASPTSEEPIGNVVYMIDQKVDTFSHLISGVPFPIYQVITGLDSSVYVLSGGYGCHPGYPLVITAQDDFGSVGDDCVLVEL